MDERTNGQRIRERAVDSTISGSVAGAAVVIGAHYFEPSMPVPVTVAWTVLLNAIGTSAIKWLRLRVEW